MVETVIKHLLTFSEDFVKTNATRIGEFIFAGGAEVIASTTHVSVIERGLKVTKLDTFVAIANALDISADALLIDVVTHSVTGVTNELSEMIEKLPKNEQKRILNAVRAFVG